MKIKWAMSRRKLNIGAAVSAALRPQKNSCLSQLLEPRMMLSGSLPVTPLNSAGVRFPIETNYLPGYRGTESSIGGDISLAAGLSSPAGGTTPAQMLGAYGLSGLSYNGAGQTIAILDPGDDSGLVNSTASNFSTSDLAVFDSYYGLPNPPSFTKMGYISGDNPTLTTTLPGSAQPYGSDGEISLDVEWTHVMAPSANIILVEGAPDFSDIFDGILAIDASASSLHIVTLSMSFVAPEDDALDGTANAEGVDGYYFDTPGVVYCASTGDYGAYDPGTSTIDDFFPASSSNVLAVGGTTLSVSGTNYAGETTWGYGTNSGNQTGGGGGFSVYEPQPTYQVGKVNGLSTTARSIPDISLEANPNTGVPIYDSPDYGVGTGWIPGLEGGTSLSSPLMAGIVAVADQGRAASGKALLASSGGAGVTASNPNGNASTSDIHTLLYGFGYSGSDFHDITSGQSIGPASYGPLTGYDLSTGIGSPNGSHTVPDLIGNTSLTLTGSAFYLKLDPDLVHLDVYNANNTSGAISQQVVASSLSSITVTGTGSPESLTVDFTNGDPIPPGLTYTASGTAGNNQLLVVGTASGNDTITSFSGQIVVNSITLNDSDVGTTSFTPGTGTDSLTLNSGTLQLKRPAGASVVTQLFSTIAINGSSKLAVAAPAAHASRVLVSTSTLTIGGGTNAWTGTLDLSGNDLAITGGNFGNTLNQVTSGFAGGLWTGTGIQSSAAATDTTHLTALGTIINNTGGATPLYGAGTALGTYDTASPGANAVLVKYTYLGDANLDGKVDGSDYTLTDNGFVNHLTGWYNGNFNYDSSVNGSDYTLIDNSFNRQTAGLAAQVATSTEKTRPSTFVPQTAAPSPIFADSATPSVSAASQIFSVQTDELNRKTIFSSSKLFADY